MMQSAGKFSQRKVRNWLWGMLLALAGAPVVMLAQEKPEQPRLTSSDFASAAECGTCHQTIYEQWKTSMHSKSFQSPLFRKVVNRLMEQPDGARNRYFCLSCHTPVGSVGGEAFRVDLPIRWDELSGTPAEGVTCDFCHTLSGREPRGKEISTGAYLFPRRGSTAIKFGVHADAQPESHEVEVSTFLPSAEFCGTCHSFRHPANGIELQNTFSEWQKGPYPAQGTRCQDCHMPRFTGSSAEGAPERQDLHAHYFDRQRLLSQAANVDIKASLSNGSLNVETSLTNTGAGHSIPTGVPGLRDLRLTVEIQDASHLAMASQETHFRQVLLNDQGQEQLPWQDVKVIREERIAPGQTVSKQMTFPLPPNTRGTIRIRAQLQMLSLSPFWSEKLGLQAPPPILMAERIQSVQVP